MTESNPIEVMENLLILENIIKDMKNNPQATPERKVEGRSTRGFVKFKNKETKRLPRLIRDDFATQDSNTVSAEKRVLNGKVKYILTLRCWEYSDIKVEDCSLKRAKKKFIAALASCSAQR